ncbi:rCG57490 [Rattus norvegicus]|uniref:RCG57490 n=1 Tax=Rattus norvegicus TaxID=10116 RepID=A6JHI2_RAT|nr:rCG57490 [Rattus norvegicus]
MTGRYFVTTSIQGKKLQRAGVKGVLHNCGADSWICKTCSENLPVQGLPSPCLVHSAFRHEWISISRG